MSQYLPPIHINKLFNVSDFNYQYDFISYFIGDSRYVKKDDLKVVVGPTGATGFKGYTGATGYTGYSGATGYTGYSGATGYTGYTGYSGATGYTGYTGYSGATGYTGYTGATGYTGYTGCSGATGYTGYSGATGYTGYSGATGYTGCTGSTGATGYTGMKGSSGINGANGLNGSNGANGSNGKDGSNGAQAADILGSLSLIGSIANAVASSAVFVSLSTAIATNLALFQAYVVSNDAALLIVQLKTQFQSYTLDLSENRNSTIFNSNVKITDGIPLLNGSNEIVNIYVTKPSTFKLGIETQVLKNDGILTQVGTSIFNDNVVLQDYIKNQNTNTQQTIIPNLTIAPTQVGNKIILFNKNNNVNPYICGFGITQDTTLSGTPSYMNYYCNDSGTSSGHRFYTGQKKSLDINGTSMTHVGSTCVLCADSNLNSGFQFENNKSNEISLLFKSDISDSISDTSIVVSNTNHFFTPNSGKMIINSGEVEFHSNRFSQYFNNTFSTNYVNSDQLININKISSTTSNISDVTQIITSNISTFEDDGNHELKCRTSTHTGTYSRNCILNNTGITHYNDRVNGFVSTNYKTSSLLTNVVDASIVVKNNNSIKENYGTMNLNAGVINIGTNSPDPLSSSSIIIGSSLSNIFIPGNLIFNNTDMKATNLPDYIRQIVRNRI